MRLRVFFFDTTCQSYHGQWSDAMKGQMFEPDRYIKMIDTTVGDWPSDTDILNDTFRETQNDVHVKGWRPSMSNDKLGVCRSSCVGDVFAVDDRWYMVDRIGFKKIDPLE